jgi:hypothetical protein
MRQSGSALRKLIRAVAAAGFWSGEANGEKQDVPRKSELRAAAQRYWDTLFIRPWLDHGWSAAFDRID